MDVDARSTRSRSARYTDRSSSINFVIKKKNVGEVKKHFEKLCKLFGVKVKLQNIDGDNQWICLESEEGSDKETVKAKDYILALVCPDSTIPVSKVWDHPHFNDLKQLEIERESGAVLVRHGASDVQIRGTELNVMIAMSLIDEMFCKKASDEPDKHDASVVCLDDTEDEETQVLGLYGGIGPRGNNFDVSTIVISSDDEDSKHQGARPKQFVHSVRHSDMASQRRKANDSSTITHQGNPSEVLSYQHTALSSRFGSTKDTTRSKRDPEVLAATEQMRNPGSTAAVPCQVNSSSVLSHQHRVVPGSVQEANGNKVAQGSSAKADLQLASMAQQLLKEIAEGTHPPPEGAEGPSEEEYRQKYIDSLMGAPSPAKPRRGLKHIIIDGSNVAMGHGKNTMFSVPGIEICIKFFLKRGHKEITAFVPEWRRYTNNVSSVGRELLNRLNQAGFVKFTPARRVQDRSIASYDDRFILSLAVETDGIVVSNDLFRDLQVERKSFQEVASYRLLQYTFVGDFFMVPEDPLGRYGPSLDEFLRHPNPTHPGRPTTGLPRDPETSKPDSTHCRYPRTVHKNNTLKETICAEKGKPKPLRILPLRSEDDTHRLYAELRKVFPGPEHSKALLTLLRNHKREINLEHLINYYFSATQS